LCYNKVRVLGIFATGIWPKALFEEKEEKIDHISPEQTMAHQMAGCGLALDHAALHRRSALAPPRDGLSWIASQFGRHGAVFGGDAPGRTRQIPVSQPVHT
jgi:hypothetical protein